MEDAAYALGATLGIAVSLAVTGTMLVGCKRLYTRLRYGVWRR